ncbi:acid phosphatase [Aphelenchoides avenae]|nr:acid phosphatase [Aphelenchus avenae]
MSRAIKRVYDEPNPFAPDFKRGREKPKPAVVNRMKTRLQGIDVYTRHKQLINAYLLYHPGASKTFQRDASSDKNDYDIIRENHKFVWGDDEVTEVEQSWEARLAKKYYDKLFKEYCIADLSQFEKNRIAMRWRTEKEVRSGKGQFECGSKHCTERDDLSTWEKESEKQAKLAAEIWTKEAPTAADEQRQEEEEFDEFWTTFCCRQSLFVSH